MTGNDFQVAALRTATGAGRSFMNAALGISGEAGEVCDIIKKAVYQGHEMDTDHIVEELGDLMWYVALMAYMCGETLDGVMQKNVDKLWKRYPDGFSTERSVNRDC